MTLIDTARLGQIDTEAVLRRKPYPWVDVEELITPPGPLAIVELVLALGLLSVLMLFVFQLLDRSMSLFERSEKNRAESQGAMPSTVSKASPRRRARPPAVATYIVPSSAQSTP